MDIERALVKTSMGYIHYRAAGRGAPVVLLHMNQQSSALYLELMAVLAPGVRAIAIDYPSHGMSDHVTIQPTIADYARCVLEVVDALELKTRASSANPAAQWCVLNSRPRTLNASIKSSWSIALGTRTTKLRRAITAS